MHPAIRHAVKGDLGPELFSNSTFDANVTGWAASGLSTLAWVAGEAEATITGAGGIEDAQTLALVTGARYRLAFVCRQGTYVGQFAVRVGGTVVRTGPFPATSYETVVEFIAPSADPLITITRNSAATGTFYFNSISLKRL